MQPSSSGLDENRNPTMKTTEILQGSVPQDGMSLTYSLNQTFHHIVEKCFIMSLVKIGLLWSVSMLGLPINIRYGQQEISNQIS